ncbi:nitrate/nitrite transporter [Nonomuraea sp. NPDC050227]|uniref:nitrate/nitrite transporter n=1 Tax=Nonomuraea sp. NPDC050227 TaxID=3364360 RepID=UPI0037B9FC6F
MWGLASLIYATAMFHRTSLTVAVDLAEQRFQIGPGALSLLAVYQLLAYAILQLPAGLAADRLGPRKTLLVAMVLIGGGQIGFSLATAYPLALLARGILGVGDALTFMGGLRLITAWNASNRVALQVQLMSVIGMAGSLISTIPLSFALTTIGWTPTFLSTGATTICLAVVVLLTVKSDPPTPRSPSVLPGLFRDLRSVWLVPGTRLGMWMVIASAFSFVSFSTLWGYPYLTRAQGLGADSASRLLTVLILTNMITGPLFGLLASRRPELRTRLSGLVITLVCFMWVVLLLWPGRAPSAAVVALVLVLGLCGPATMLGVDVARTSNDATQVATAAAMVNLGGYVAALLTILSVGWLLDLGQRNGLSVGAAFALAFGSQLVLFLFAGLQIFYWVRKVRAQT